MNIYLGILGFAVLLNLLGFLWLVVVGFKRSIVWGLLVLLLSPLSALIFALTNWFDARKPFLVYFTSLLLLLGTGLYIYTEAGSANLQKISKRLETGEITVDEAMRLLEKTLVQPGIALFEEQAPDTRDAGNNLAEPGDQRADVAAKVDDAKIQEKPVVAEADAQRSETPAAGTDGQTSVPETGKQSEEVKTESARPPHEPAQPATPIPGKVVPDPLAVPRKEREDDSVTISLDKINGFVGRYLILEMKNGTQQRGLLSKVDEKSLLLHRKLYGGSMEYRVYTSQIKSARVLKKGAEP